MEDKQLSAIQKVVEALSSLEDADRCLVLGYINMRFSGASSPSPLLAATPTPPQNSGAEQQEFKIFPDLYHAANPETESEKALIGGYWLQCCQGQDSFDSFTINSLLKGMGYSVSNITRAIDALMAQDPKPVMQLKKSGLSRQARKSFKLTTTGIKRVAEMLATGSQQ